MRETDEFYARVLPASLGGDETNVARQAYAGLLWSKQFYTAWFATGWMEIRRSPRHPRNGIGDAITAGTMSLIGTSFLCRTNGSTPGGPGRAACLLRPSSS